MGLSNILMIPGVTDPVSEINTLLFGAGQQGTFIAPSLTASLISGSTFGTGVETLPDLSPRNNPFSQATPSSRGAWFREPKTGRRNLLLQTESYIGWVNQPRNAVFGIDDPFGGNLAVTVKSDASSQNVYRPANFAAQGSGNLCVNSVYVRRRLGTGTITFTNPSNVGVNITSQVDGTWKRIVTTAATTTDGGIGTGNFVITLATSGDEIDLAFPQAELGSTPTPYQRVTTAFDVTEAGQRDCYGVRGDGIDDGYATAGNVDFSGTPRVTVFAAVRKLSDAALSSVVSLPPSGTGNQRFGMRAPQGASDRYGYVSQGTSLQFLTTTSSSFNAPNTSILTGESDISAPLIRLRINGNLIAENSLSQGSGNYQNAALQLLSHSGSAFFNGNLYALIVAGGSYPLSTIQRVERILSRITPTVNL